MINGNARVALPRKVDFIVVSSLSSNDRNCVTIVYSVCRIKKSLTYTRHNRNKLTRLLYVKYDSLTNINNYVTLLSPT